ncbi:unnamed protein product [Caenorhabditis bovis]|uniref:Uncharacterized protein n=1 Tax=Caenorhabditis bovis TaxID=2654633 RepID=A0A8S1EKV1_9PELO|nr:unnamed protein product [Caenorhabditis bovis]
MINNFALIVLISRYQFLECVKHSHPWLTPQFRLNDIQKTADADNLTQWKENFAFRKVSSTNNLFCKIYGYCREYEMGLSVINILTKWKNMGLIYPYKKYDGRADPNFPYSKLQSFVSTMRQKNNFY